MPFEILIVEDDPSILEVVVFAMEKAGHKAVTAKDGEAALSQFGVYHPDLIILDVGLPGIDGLEVCRRIRRSSDVPILFLSARDEEIDRILGLEIGGDDYVTKPFSPRELSARVSNILRREHKTPKQNDSCLTHGRLVVNIESHKAELGEELLALTATEFSILKALMQRPAAVLSRAQLLDSAYKGLHVSDRTIDSHIRNLRSKLKRAGGKDVIETVYGVGFRLAYCD